MDLTKYYPDIAAKYPAYVTKRELCEICHICPKTAYNLEQQGEIPYTIEQNHLIRSHKIKLTDKFSGARLVTVTAKTAGEAMDLVDRSEGEDIAVIEELS